MRLIRAAEGATCYQWGMASAPGIPDRLLQTFDLMELAPDDRELEVGGGRGVLAELILRRPATGGLVGIDRSSAAVQASETRNAAAVADDRARFRQLALHEVDPDDLGRFDVVVAVNVNLFWTSPASHELAVVRRLLAPDGVFWIVYHPPTAATFRRLRSRVGDHLAQAGFRVDVSTLDTVPMIPFAAYVRTDRLNL
jgi:SAM-dependent methyltransferase